jgi:hypothetical protein
MAFIYSYEAACLTTINHPSKPNTPVSMDGALSQREEQNSRPLVFWHQLQFLAFSLQMLFCLLILDVVKVNNMYYVIVCFFNLE